MTNSRVLVTGASGFVGRWSVGPLLALGAEVHTVQRHTAGGEGATAHAVDLHDRDAVAALMRQIKPTHLLHFAWIATPGVYLTSPDNPLWLRSSLQLVETFLADAAATGKLRGEAVNSAATPGARCSRSSAICSA